MIRRAGGRPARRPASIATANMLNDSGAIERPACIALYSSTICRKIGSTIIVPPSAICCDICPVTPRRNSCDAEQVGIEQRRLPSRLRVTSQQRGCPARPAPTAISAADRLAALLPDEDAEHHAAHADDREHRADDVDAPVAGVRHVPHELDARQHDGDDHDLLEQERDPPREVGGDEAAEQRTDRGGDGRRRAHQRVDLRLRLALEVAVDERLHRGKEQ